MNHPKIPLLEPITNSINTQQIQVGNVVEESGGGGGNNGGIVGDVVAIVVVVPNLMSTIQIVSWIYRECGTHVLYVYI